MGTNTPSVKIKFRCQRCKETVTVIVSHNRKQKFCEDCKRKNKYEYYANKKKKGVSWVACQKKVTKKGIKKMKSK